MPTIITCQRRQHPKASAAIVIVLDFAKAQTFLARPLKLAEPFPSGSLIDTMARLVSASLAKITRDADIGCRMQLRGADVGFLNAWLMGAFKSADAANGRASRASQRSPLVKS